MDYEVKGVTERVLVVANFLGLSDTELAKEIGVRKQFIGNMKSGSVDLPAKRAVIFLGQHEEIDARWLLFNRGEMIVKPGKDGKALFTVKANGDMEFKPNKGDEAGNIYQEKYKATVELLEEKKTHITSLEKIIESQQKLIDQLLERSKDE